MDCEGERGTFTKQGWVFSIFVIGSSRSPCRNRMRKYIDPETDDQMSLQKGRRKSGNKNISIQNIREVSFKNDAG